MYCQLVNEQIRIKYEHQFYSHFANYISELIYRNIYTENRVQTKDLLCFISDNEYLSCYAHTFEQGYKQVICRNADYFQTPLRITTEMPLMILTNTKDILQRRKKRLRKLFLADCESSTAKSSYSSKKNPESSFSSSQLMMLNNLSKVSYTYPSSSSSSASRSYSIANIYEMQKIDQLNEPRHLAYINFQREKLSLKLQVSIAVKHLIIDFNNAQTGQIKPKRQYYQIETDSAKTKEPDQDKHQISSQIQSVVKAELKKYNIYQIMEKSSSNSSSQLKIRDKAEQLLKKLQIGSIF